MKQAVMTAPGRIEFRDAPKPVPGEGQLLLRVMRIGVCGSDLHVYGGRHPYTSYPVVQGHEASGIVEEIGPEVAGFAAGGLVTFSPQITCGACYPCRHGMYHICESLDVMGFQADGAAQEFFTVDAAKAFKVPEGISEDEAAMIEPVAVAVHALGRAGEPLDGLRIAVLGAGTIGNLVAQVARASGAAAVLVTDINEYKLAKARECGIEYAVNTSQGNLGDALRRDFGTDGADLILECVGAQATVDAAIATARKGTTIVIVGVFGASPTVDLGRVQDRELSLVGTLMYQAADYRRAIELLAGGQLRLKEMITHRFDFADYPRAYEAMGAVGGNCLKVMIGLGGNSGGGQGT